MHFFKVNKHILKNGLAVFYCHTPMLSAFEISMHINTGSRDETQNNNGVSHFLEHMMFRGSKRFPDSISLSRALESFGGEVNAMTGVEHTTYWLKGDAEKTLEAIECFADFFLHPNYADIDVERSIILQEITSDYNESGDNIETESLGMSALFPNHPIGNTIIGTREIVSKLTQQDLHEKRKNFYSEKRCAISIHTSLPENEVLKALEMHIGNPWEHALEARSVRIPVTQLSTEKNQKSKNRICLQNNPDNQFALKLIFPTVGGLSRDVIATNFLQRILDDGICTRLPATIREKYGLVYDINCDTQYFHEIGTFSVDAVISEKLLPELLQKLALELKKLLTDKPTAEEVEHIRFRYCFDIKQIKETPSRLLNREVAIYFMEQTISLDEETTIVKSLTADELFKTTHKVFYAPQRALVLVGPKARKKRDLVEKFLSTFDVKL